MFFNYIEKNMNKKQKIMKEKRKFSKSIAAFGLLLILFLTSFLIGAVPKQIISGSKEIMTENLTTGAGYIFTAYLKKRPLTLLNSARYGDLLNIIILKWYQETLIGIMNFSA